MPQKIKVAIVSPQGVQVAMTWLERQRQLWLQSLSAPAEDNEVGQGVPCPNCDEFEGCTCGCPDPHRKD